MLFLLLFLIGGLVVPVIIDVQKHGEDNIFRRSRRDLANYEMFRSATVNTEKKRVQAAQFRDEQLARLRQLKEIAKRSGTAIFSFAVVVLVSQVLRALFNLF